jgi:hypothetical protein
MSNDAKKKKAPPRRYNRRLAACISGMIFFMLWVCYWLSINLTPIRPSDELRQARAMWRAQGIDDYRMTISVGNTNQVGHLIITVIDGQVDKVLSEHPFPDERERYPAQVVTSASVWSSNFPRYLPDKLSRWTMEGLFDVAAEHLRGKPAPVLLSICGWDNMDGRYDRYNVDYDPNQGYITKLQTTCEPEWNIGLGYLCSPVKSHCYSGIHSASLEPLSTPEQ